MSTNSNKTQTPSKVQQKPTKKPPTTPIKPQRKPAAPAAPISNRVMARVKSSGATPAPTRALFQTSSVGKMSVVTSGMPVHGTSFCHGALSTQSITNGMRLVGCERIAQVSSLVSVQPGNIMAQTMLNPKSFGVRLPLMAENYEKFKFRKTRVHYVPTISPANAAANGALYLVAGFDPNQPIPTDLDALATWGRNKIVFSVFEHATLELDLTLGMQDPLFCDAEGEERFGIQAVIALVAGNPQVANFACGQLFLEYEIDLVNNNTSNLEASNTLVCFTANSSNSIGGPEFAKDFTKFAGDNDIVSIAPDNSVATWVLAPGEYFIVINQKTNGAITSGDPNVTVADVNNAVTLLVRQTAGALTTFSSPAGVTALASATLPFYPDSGVPDGSSGILNQIFYCRTLDEGTPSSIRMTQTSTISPAVDLTCEIMFIRISPGTTYNSVPTGYLLAPPRSSPNAVLTARVARMLREYDVSKEMAPAVAEFRKFCLEAPSNDNAYVNALNDCFALGLPPRDASTTTCLIHPVAASIGLFLLQKFGAKVAAHLLGMAEKKLKAWLGDKKK